MNQKVSNGKLPLIGLILVFIFLFAQNSAAQMNEVLIVKQKAKTTIRPKARPVANRVDFVRKVSIVRVSKKSRRNYRKPAVVARNTRRAPAKVAVKIEEPLLAVQLRLMLVGNDGSEVEVNPQAPFTLDDRLRLSIKANQRGFLYVIRQKSAEEDGEIIFPSPFVNGGKNLIAANYEYVIPNNCPKNVVPNLRDCALTLFPFSESPQEYFTLIFTRDQLVDLPADVQSERVSLVNLMSAGKLPTNTLVNLIEESGQDLIAQTGDTPFGVRIVNQNPNDNEEIIETFILNKTKK